MSPFSTEDVPVGSVEFVRKFATLTGVTLPAPLNIPSQLIPYTEGIKTTSDYMLVSRRNISISKRGDIKKFPVFVKPLNAVKEFTGFVAKSDKDFDLYQDVDWNTIELFCSDPIEADILSEWRCYVLYGKIVNVSNYSGEPTIFPNIGKVEMFIKNYTEQPAAYSIDVAVVDGGIPPNRTERMTPTILIECNDAWALGPYGCPPELYAKMIRNRWKEIIKNQ